jgi:hypothetical protein
MFTEELAGIASRGGGDCQPLSSPTRVRTHSVDSPSFSFKHGAAR